MTLTELFTAIANAIRAKTGKTESIVAENFPSEIEAIKTGAENVVEFTAPKGRMKGDFDGDGFITQSDVDGVSAHTSTGGANITDPVQFWCADTLCDNTIDAKDKLNIQKHLIGTANSFCVAYSRYGVNPDYYNNWSFYFIDSLHGYFYYDVPVSGMTANSSALLLASAYSDCFIGVECMNGIARIKAERLPLTETDCLIVWEVDGKEWEEANGGFETANIDIPLGRMKGDVDGDGFITFNADFATDTSTDAGKLYAHMTGTGTITDEVALWCANVNNDSLINGNDLQAIMGYFNGTANALTATPTMADYYGNWTWFKVDDLSGYFYRDIPIAGMTANSTAVLLVSNYADCFIGVECLEGVARIKASRCPVAACKGYILWKGYERLKSKYAGMSGTA